MSIESSKRPAESGADEASASVQSGRGESAPAARESAVSREQALALADAWVGRTLDGRYRLEARLGAGGVGAVYRATQLNLNRTVAVKILLEGLHPTFRARFEREARALASLRHPNIVTVTDFGVARSEIEGAEQQTPYIVMELIEGVTLHYRLQQGPIPAERVQVIARELLRALSFVHEQGLVHRDLKPGNVLIEKLPHDEERIRLLDFGLAKALEGSVEGESVTRAGDVLGTPAYMAPEQVGGDQVDVRTDTYAFGVLLFQMLAGQVPFGGEPVEMLRSHIIAPPPSIADKRPAIIARPELEALIAKALSKKRDARFQTATEMLAALEAIEQPWLAPRAAGEIEPKTTLQDTGVAETINVPTQMHVTQLADSARSTATPSATATISPAKRMRSRRLGTIVGAVIAGLLMALSTMFDSKPDPEPAVPVAATAPARTDQPRPAEPKVAEKAPEAVVAPSAPPTMEFTQAEADEPAAPTPTATPAAPAVEAARNPWAQPGPKNLMAARKALLKGEKGSERLVSALRRYNREHPEDPRGNIVLALIYRNRNWREDELKQYQTALQRDPRSRGTPEMLRDMLQLVALGESVGERAADQIRTTYGAEALASIDAAIQSTPTDGAGRDRWVALRASIAH